MLRNILIPLDTSRFTQVAIQVAANIALKVQESKENARVCLDGLGIVDTDQIPSGRFAYLVPREKIMTEARETVQGLLDQFMTEAKDLKIPEDQISCRLTEGSPFQKIVHHHVFSDLVVMGMMCSFPPAQHDYETFVHLLYNTSRPVLLVPEKAQPGKNVLMLMDGTAPSSRMLNSYVHLNPFPGANVTVVSSSLEEERYTLKDFFERLQSYMESFGIDAHHVRVQGELYGQLPDLISEYGADTVAAGVHAEHVLHKFGRALHVFPLPVEALMGKTGVCVLSVH